MTRRRALANPWLKKNPLLSIWLSAANTMLGVARGQMSAAVARSARAAAAGTTTGGTARKPAAKRRSSSTASRRKRP